MPRPLGTIRIMISSRALLDMEEADRIFREKGVEEYKQYIRAEGPYQDAFDPEISGRRLQRGPLAGLAQAAIDLNRASGKPLIEIGVLCKDTSETALPVFRSLGAHGLYDARFQIATNGNAPTLADHQAFGTDLLLTRNAADAQFAVDNGIAAAVVNFPPAGERYEHPKGAPINLWVDGDAVTFGSSSELFYKQGTLEQYYVHESENFDKPIEPGPFSALLRKISELNATLPKAQQPFQLSLLTARGGESAPRVHKIAQDLKIAFNGRMVFMGGAAKVDVLKAHKPDLFLDDQMVHLTDASQYCPTGLVPYPKGSPMYEFLQAAADKAKQTPPPAGNDNQAADAKAPPAPGSKPGPV